jgi:hypothetical protein
MGNIVVISTSKIRKITEIIKNRIEKEERLLCSGSKPHSNALNFSWFIFILFVFKKEAKKISAPRIIRISKFSIRNKIKILFCNLFNWKLNVLLLY